MSRVARFGLLIAGLGLTALLVGCPGLPGAPGAGGGSAAQQAPPGLQPPSGLTSGGVRTLMGTTVTPPEKSTLLVSYTTTTGASVQNASARRLTFSESTVLIEGRNYDGRDANQPKDVNLALPLAQISSLSWSYKENPTPPPSPTGKPGAAPSARGANAPAPARGPARGK